MCLPATAASSRRVLIVSLGATSNAAADVVTRPSLSVAVRLTLILSFCGVPAIVPLVASTRRQGAMRPTPVPRCRCRFHLLRPRPSPTQIPDLAARRPGGAEGRLHAPGLARLRAHMSSNRSCCRSVSVTKPELPSAIGVPVSRFCGERARLPAKVPPSSTGPLRLHDGARRRVQGHDLLRGERVRVGLAVRRPLQGLVLDLEYTGAT